MYLRQIPRAQLADVIDTLFRFRQDHAAPKEGLGAFLRRQGPDAVIAHLAAQTTTAELMQKTFRTDDVLG